MFFLKNVKYSQYDSMIIELNEDMGNTNLNPSIAMKLPE